MTINPFPKVLHRCWITSAEKGFGAAIDQCFEHEDGTLRVDNDEYGSLVNFCPICGYKAKVPVEQHNWGRADE